MSKNKKRTRTTVLIVIALIAFIIVTPFTGIYKAYANNGATIGGVNVGDMKEDEIRQTLQTAIDAWSGNTPVIEGGGASLQVDASTIKFNLDSTISTYETLTKKPWYAFWVKKSPVHIPLEVTGTEQLKADIEQVGTWDVEETYALVMQQIVHLKSEAVAAVVTDTSILESERLAYIIEEIPVEAKAVYDMAQFLDGKVIGANENFSLLNTLGTIANNSNVDGLSFIGSLFYYNALNTNTEITERHSQTVIPNYLEAGIEAAVSVVANKDFSFTNKSDNPIKIKTKVEGQKLKLEFFSNVKTNSVSVQVRDSGEVKPRTIVRYSDDLAAGSQRLMQEGEKGARVIVYRTIDGFEEQISRDYYPPVNRIVLKSSREVQQVENGATTGGTTSPDAKPGGSTGSGSDDDVIDADNNGLPDINQGVGREPAVDKDGNVVLPKGTVTDKAGNVISTPGGSAK